MVFFLGLEEIITLQSQFSQNMSNYQYVELVTANNKMMLVIVQMRTQKKKKKKKTSLTCFQKCCVYSITLKEKKYYELYG